MYKQSESLVSTKISNYQVQSQVRNQVRNQVPNGVDILVWNQLKEDIQLIIKERKKVY